MDHCERSGFMDILYISNFVLCSKTLPKIFKPSTDYRLVGAAITLKLALVSEVVSWSIR